MPRANYINFAPKVSLRRGLSLVEALLAVSLFGGSVAGLGSIILGSNSVAQRAWTLRQAVELAQNRLEIMKVTPPDNQYQQNGRDGALDWTITCRSKPMGLRLVRVQVNWTVSGRGGRYELSELLPPAGSEPRP